MKLFLYPKLALSGIRKNRRLYAPYLLTCIGMVMMHSIIGFLSVSPAVQMLPGGATICAMMYSGQVIIAIFSALFLFYTSSFLMRRRTKEFGLYNVLGMGKGNIGLILLWESLLLWGASMAAGLVLGILLSKLFELGLVKIMAGTVDFHFYLSAKNLSSTLLTFSLIFALLLVRSFCLVQVRSPVALLRSENAGEKAPRANYLLGIAGIVLLAVAYTMAVRIEDPLSAVSLFFVAVALVILATYLLFISGSVMLCRVLQKCKRYYYKANHFVSVSSMVYRMKRNGAGLASICILLTMVLVMLSSTACLYVGKEDSLQTRYPRDINLQFSLPDLGEGSQAYRAALSEQIAQTLSRHELTPEHILNYRVVGSDAFLDGDRLEIDPSARYDVPLPDLGSLTQFYMVPLEDYNQMTGQALSLSEGEVLLSCQRIEYSLPTLSIGGQLHYRVKGTVADFLPAGEDSANILPVIYMITGDFSSASEQFAQLATGSDRAPRSIWRYGFDLDADSAEIIACYQDILADVNTFAQQSPETQRLSPTFTYDCREVSRGDFYGTFGGLFYMGGMLSVVFLAAAVLIIYYKQICEGYEDQARFDIMCKVGMTSRDIRRSINSQMLTVFLLPLLTALLHLCFAYPMIEKILLLFNLTNRTLLLATTGVCFLLFSGFYCAVYRLTSNVYYRIVHPSPAV